MILTFRPIKVWPPTWLDADAQRPSSPFDSTYSATVQLLDRELDQLGATDVFLQVDARSDQIRLDGQLKANAAVDHPGVILTIETPHLGVLVYDTDRYQRAAWKRNAGPAWQQNLRAIALGLEALRKVERYGIGDRGQQYAGYRELGSGIALGATAMTIEEAARYIAEHTDNPDWVTEVADDPFLALALFKDAAKLHHPDVGGDPEIMRCLVEARDMLVEHQR